MELTEIIAFFAVVVAILSAWYTKNAVHEAKRANGIAIHNHRLEIYAKFINLKWNIKANGQDFEILFLNDFYKPKELASFYFSENLSNMIEEYYIKAGELFIVRDRYNREESRGREVDSKYIDEVFDKLDECEKYGEELNTLLRKELKVKSP